VCRELTIPPTNTVREITVWILTGPPRRIAARAAVHDPSQDPNYDLRVPRNPRVGATLII